jgi:protein involved in polysaccharide export with SLBB domain
MRMLNLRNRALKVTGLAVLAAAWLSLPLVYAQEKAAAANNINKEDTTENVPTLEDMQAMAKDLEQPKSQPAQPVAAAAPAEAAQRAKPEPIGLLQGFDPLKYTLGPDDVVEIEVMRHPEFSGSYPIDQEGKLQYKFVGDMKVVGLTKFQLEEKIREIISKYVISPEVNVNVAEFRSKVFYVLGEVGSPGKYYMRSENISVRDAVVMAGLPTQAAAMRKSRIITPDDRGGKVRNVDVYGLLYDGDLSKNLVMKPGDFLYVPSTVMAKVFRVISPASSAVATAVSPVGSIADAQGNSNNLRNNNNR